jgi:hypothetical protein
MDPVGGKADENGEVTKRPNDVAEASLHKGSWNCQWLRQHGRMMALPPQASNQKLARLPLRSAEFGAAKRLLSILFAGMIAAASTASTKEEPLGGDEHEREELGLNSYTAPSIARIFQQLDQLKPLPFDQLKRAFPRPISASREQKGLIFGGLIADGFLMVEAERKNVVEDFGHVLMREARGLGVADCVTRHSASLTELGRRGDWARVRKELIATQADVEQAMMDLRDEKMAHLISLGGWLRGLEISAGAVAANFSAARAKVLAQPDLANYFAAELKTLPPEFVHAPLFEKIRVAVNAICLALSKSADELTLVDVRAIHAEVGAANEAIRQVN